MKHLLGQVDRVAGIMNAWLLVIAIGLAAFDLTLFIGLNGPQALALLTQPVGRVADRGGDPRAAARPHQVANY